MSSIITGLDIGTGNIRVVIAEVLNTGTVQVIGVGKAPSTGLKKGVVVNIESTVRGINAAVEDAEMMSGLEIDSCYTGLGGSHIEGLNSKGVYPIPDKENGNKEIDYDDIDAVINSAKAVVVPMDRQIMSIIPQFFIVDQQTGIKDPYNRIGVRLEAEAHIITGSVTAIKNIISCVTRADLNVSKVMYNGLAAEKSVMTDDERELGSVLIDIGAGVTDVVVMCGGAPLLTAVLPIGGSSITSDIAAVKNISVEKAEEIKTTYGCCWHDLIEGDDEILLPGIGGHAPIRISKTEICDIIQIRMAEIFYIIKKRIDPLIKNKPMGGNIVLCGGGACLLGIVELVCHIFETSAVRVGFPGTLGNAGGNYRNPDFAAVIGMILEIAKNFDDEEDKTYIKKSNGNLWADKTKKFLKKFFKNLF